LAKPRTDQSAVQSTCRVGIFAFAKWPLWQ
jgi:hypothetical protein